MFQLNEDEVPRFKITNRDFKVGAESVARSANAFTEQGVAMLSSVPRSNAPSRSTSRSCERLSACAASSVSRPTRSQAPRPREEIRYPIQGRLRRHSRTDDSSANQATTNRLQPRLTSESAGSDT